MAIFQRDKLIVRKLHEKDAYQLAKWLSDPNVLKCYEGRDQPFDLAKVNDKFYGQNDGVMRCIIEYAEAVVGYIQYYELDEQTKSKYGYRNSTELIYGMDQFIGEADYRNTGIGQLLVNAMVDYLMKQKRADTIVMDPRIANKRAIKCYQKCRFHKVKVLPDHELHEGGYRDCYLMEYSN